MVSTRPVYRPPAPPPQRRLPPHVYWRRRALVVLAAITIGYVVYMGSTLAVALTNQAYGASYMARAAEWGRQHGMGGVVTWVETEWYKLHPARKGGLPSGSHVFGEGPTKVVLPSGVAHLPAPTTIATPAAHALPGEGVWHVVARRASDGAPGLYVAYVRPDPVHTSYVVGVAWMDPTVLQAQLYSGSFIPGVGMPFRHTAPIPPVASRSLVAAFNAGFRMQDANGGYYTDGRTLIPLRTGAASAVVYRDGQMTVGAWGQGGLVMSAQVASVRQNLDLIVRDGRAVPGLANQNTDKWGKVIGNSFNVWRSGMGVTKNGAIVYVGGPALSISDLANVLVRAGVQSGMELDINTDWVQFAYFAGAPNAAVSGANGTNLLGGMTYPPSRFFASWMNRDFYTMSLRSTPLPSTTTTVAGG
ncbi:MAG TPA: hypothetical protein VGS61_08005 [Acidimicrobiales bacterium]|nr:hypothetical protein [Acidimicrobiales bacterium]